MIRSMSNGDAWRSPKVAPAHLILSTAARALYDPFDTARVHSLRAFSAQGFSSSVLEGFYQDRAGYEHQVVLKRLSATKPNGSSALRDIYHFPPALEHIVAELNALAAVKGKLHLVRLKFWALSSDCGAVKLIFDRLPGKVSHEPIYGALLNRLATRLSAIGLFTKARCARSPICKCCKSYSSTRPKLCDRCTL